MSLGIVTHIFNLTNYINFISNSNKSQLAHIEVTLITMSGTINYPMPTHHLTTTTKWTITPTFIVHLTVILILKSIEILGLQTVIFTITHRMVTTASAHFAWTSADTLDVSCEVQTERNFGHFS